jgi:hypothetical protein
MTSAYRTPVAYPPSNQRGEPGAAEQERRRLGHRRGLERVFAELVDLLVEPAGSLVPREDRARIPLSRQRASEHDVAALPAVQREEPGITTSPA